MPRNQQRKKPGASRAGRLSFGMISLGCAKNLVDAEGMAGAATAAGVPFCFDAEAADVVVVNTCAFLSSAIEEALEEIARQVERKKKGECAAVIVMGCLPGRFPGGAPEGLDGWIGPGQGAAAAALVAGLSSGGRRPRSSKKPEDRPAGPCAFPAETGRLRFTPAHFAYLKITEGCDNRCRYCTIPSIRGPLRCKPLAEILREARELVTSGARELVLIGQDTTAWTGERGQGLASVVEAVAGIDGLRWLRLMYAHPARVGDALISALASGPPVLPYLDLPVQHFSDRILKAMGRPYGSRDLLALIRRLRDRLPGLVLRSTVMTGFPGEEKSDFEKLLKGVRKAGFERLGAFLWSPEEGTPAAGLRGRIGKREGLSRLREIELASAALRDEYHESRVGTEAEAVVDLGGGASTLARTFAEAPEVDPVVILEGPYPAGAFGRVRITGLRGPDLTAEGIE